MTDDTEAFPRPGQPTKYKPEYCDQVKKLALLGLTDVEMAWFLGLDDPSEIELYRESISRGRSDRPGYLAAVEERRERKRPVRAKSQKKRRAESPQVRLCDSVRSLVYCRLKYRGKRRTFDILGYSVEELRSHLESQFRDGMSWDNYGPYWHVDHIRPDCSFTYETPEDPDFKACWSLSNLQPLLKYENLSKGGKYAGS